MIDNAEDLATKAQDNKAGLKENMLISLSAMKNTDLGFPVLEENL